MKPRSLLHLAACGALSLGLSLPSLANDWPARSITLVVPSAAGGAADLTARTLAQFLNDTHRLNVVAENRPGAGGVIGTAAVQQAKPDGYTFLLSTNSTQSANQFLYQKLPYDAAKDFVNVGMIGKFGTVAVVSPDSAFNTLQELVAAAKATPETVFFGYYSSSSQVPSELLKQHAGLKIEGAAYKNITQILTDLRGGQIQFAFVDYLTAMGQIAGGGLKPIAVTGAKPNPAWPGVPTTDSIYPGFVVEGWLGISAPAGTPEAIVRKMNGYIGEALGHPETHARYVKLGLQPEPMTVDAFQAFIRDDVARWKTWIGIAGIKPQ